MKGLWYALCHEPEACFWMGLFAVGFVYMICCLFVRFF